MAAADVDNWMPLWIGDYLADTMHLSAELHGGYLLLLMHLWKRGAVEDDDETLATVARMAPASWKRARARLAPYFTIAGGFWRHDRLDREKARALDTNERVGRVRSEAGRAGAQARWGRREPHASDDNGDGKPDGNGHGKRMANAWQTDGSPPPPSASSLRSDAPSAREAVEVDGGRAPGNWADWASWWRTVRGIEVGPGNGHDRKRFVPLASRWIAAGVTCEQMRRALEEAEATATEPIAYLPAYVGRVLANQQAPPRRTATAADERAAYLASLSGTPRPDPSVIDVEPAQPAAPRLAASRG